MKANRRQGFTLLELIVVVTIIATLAGAAVPVTSKMLNHRAEQATAEELQVLADACAAYFEDTQELPGDLSDLLVDPQRPGWTGPYLPGVVADRSGTSGYLLDGWSRAYAWRVDGDIAVIVSSGRDAEFNGERDVEIQIDVTPLRRAATVDRLAVINAAVRAYNDRFLGVEPLSGDWHQACEQLIAAGLLPRADVYRQDSWGAAFVPSPRDQLPVVAIDSIHLERTVESGAPGERPSQRTGSNASAREFSAGANAWPRRQRSGR